jgi:uncharacterized protein YndB with AHSA1/START domain
MNPSPKSPAPSSSGGIEIVTTRVFTAPRAAVFAAFADPERLARWWGPNGFRNTMHEFDLRPGGSWRFTMHGPDGQDYPNESRFVTVIPEEKIVFEHLQPMHWFRMEMTYEDAGAGQARLTWRMTFERTEENEKLRAFIAQANEQNFDRLAEELKKG